MRGSEMRQVASEQGERVRNKRLQNQVEGFKTKLGARNRGRG